MSGHPTLKGSGLKPMVAAMDLRQLQRCYIDLLLPLNQLIYKENIFSLIQSIIGATDRRTASAAMAAMAAELADIAAF